MLFSPLFVFHYAKIWTNQYLRRGIFIKEKENKSFDGIIQAGPFKLDIIVRRAYKPDGTNLPLTPKEFTLLLILSQNEGRFVDSKYLYEKIWETPMSNDSNALKTTINRLRAKIAGSGWSIGWLRGEGYIFEKE